MVLDPRGKRQLRFEITGVKLQLEFETGVETQLSLFCFTNYVHLLYTLFIHIQEIILAICIFNIFLHIHELK
jgi:hypothetical protein